MRMTDIGLKFESSGRIIGRYESPMIGVFLLGELYGVVEGDGTRITFLRAVAGLTESERTELADHQIAQWQRFKEGSDTVRIGPTGPQRQADNEPEKKPHDQAHGQPGQRIVNQRTMAR